MERWSDVGGVDHLEVNRAKWDERALVHAGSAEYALDRFRSEPSYLSDVVRFDLPRLGSVEGLRGVHLQCHIGTDTLSLHRLGARMSGLDLSPVSIETARGLAADCGADIGYVVGDTYSAPDLLGREAFDLVFTGVGALCWLPSITRWAETVAALLRPGGRLFLREGHPVMWAVEPVDGRLVLDWPYFEQPDPVVYDEPGTYVTTDHEFAAVTAAEWNHGLGEIVGALVGAGLTITGLVEHRTVPWEAYPGLMVRDADNPNEWAMRERPELVPLSYTLQARR